MRRSLRSILKGALRLAALLVILFAVVACDGPTGPTGRQGTPGTPGSAGVPQLVFSGAIPYSGLIVIDLPATVGTTANPPVIDCYVSEGHNTLSVRHPISNEFSRVSARCAIGVNADGTLRIELEAPSGSFYHILVFTSGEWVGTT